MPSDEPGELGEARWWADLNEDDKEWLRIWWFQHSDASDPDRRPIPNSSQGEEENSE